MHSVCWSDQSGWNQRKSMVRTAVDESTTMVSIWGDFPLSATSRTSWTTYGRSPKSLIRSTKNNALRERCHLAQCSVHSRMTDLWGDREELGTLRHFTLYLHVTLHERHKAFRDRKSQTGSSVFLKDDHINLCTRQRLKRHILALSSHQLDKRYWR